MNKKMKYLKKFDQERVYEEISFKDAAMIMTQLVNLGTPQAGTITLQQAMQQTSDTQLKVEIGVSRTTGTNVCYNNSTYVTQEVQENLPQTKEAGSPTYTIKFKESELLKAIDEGREVFFYSKYISDAEAKTAGAKKTFQGDLQTTNFLKVGSQVINGKGTVFLDLTDGTDEEIIASGNGLLLLMRLAANNQKNLDQGKGVLKLNIMNMGEATAGKDKTFKDTDIISIYTNSDKATPARTFMYFLFTVSDPIYNQAIKKPLSDKSQIYKYQGLHGKRRYGLRDGQIVDHRLLGLGDIINKTPEVNGVIPQERDEMVIDQLSMELMLMNDFIYPTIKSAEEKPGAAKIMSREEIKGYLDRFKSGKTDSEKDKVFIEFMEKAMDDYKNNFLEFVDSYTKNLGISRETVLQEFDIDQACKKVITQLKNILSSQDKQVKDKSGDMIYVPGERSKQIKTISQTEGTIPQKSLELPPPFKKVEVSKTDVVEGKTKYIIKTKYSSADLEDLEKIRRRGENQIKTDPTIKNERFKFLKTFERFKY